MQGCLELREACGDAIDWIETNRAHVPRLDRESASLTLRLRRARNKTRTLARNSGRPYAVGFFGLSQAGKSYLISALAANANGALDVNLGVERLSFLTHINPPGGGREATGLVTRFTRRQLASPINYPVRLELLSEADLVKILGNAYFNDFDREHAPFDVDAGAVRGHLAQLEGRRAKDAKPLPGMDADDVVDLRDYFERWFPRSTESLKADFWPSSTNLAAFLDGDGRAELFSLLWGKLPELTNAFRHLCGALAKLRFAAQAHCELAALVTRNLAGEWVSDANIVDVGILEHLGKDHDKTLRVLPATEAQSPQGSAAMQPISIPRSVLAALTAEIGLVLSDPPRTDLLERVDLLDFPGYRGRLSIGSLEEVGAQLKDTQLDPVAQLFLRGKVSYLFERYTEEQEMNALVLCTPSNQQSDINDLGPVLTSWIETTQGADCKTRAMQPRPGLLWALTKFDQRLDVVPGKTADQMRQGWEGMIKFALIERFGRYDWLHTWTPGACFDNLFLMRKPGMAGAVIRTEGTHEIEPRAEQAERLALLRSTFCEHTLVRKHIRDPDVAWDAMLTLNDGGASRLIDELSMVVDPGARLHRICDEIEALATDIRARLGCYYLAEGAEAVEDKQRVVRGILAPLSKKASRIGDLMHLLQPLREQLRALYLRTNAGDEDDTIDLPGDDVVDPDDIIDLPEDQAVDLGDIIDLPPKTSVAPTMDRAARYARDAMRSWVSQLKELPDRDCLLSYFNFTEPVFESLIRELVTGADRHGLERIMIAELRKNENRGTTLREQLVARQVDVVYWLLCGFIDSLEHFTSSDTGPDLFATSKPLEYGQLPELPPEPDNFRKGLIVAWFKALQDLAINNAGYTIDQEITPEQNRRLGEILAKLEAR